MQIAHDLLHMRCAHGLWPVILYAIAHEPMLICARRLSPVAHRPMLICARRLSPVDHKPMLICARRLSPVARHGGGNFSAAKKDTDQ